MNRNLCPIGVFDSGVGGLIVVKELKKFLPYEKIIYFGDTARVPYGNKSEGTVIKFTLENILFLLRKEVKLIVIACNTSSSLALPAIKKHFRIPLMGVISPSAKEAVYATRNKRVGVIGTRATVLSGAYEKEIRELDPSIKVRSEGCPLFVPLVENNWLKGEIVTKITQHYLKPLKKFDIDTLILGCTHYPLFKPVISEVMGKDVVLIDSARQVAMEVKEILKQEALVNKSKRIYENNLVCFVTDKSQPFRELGERFLGQSLGHIYEVHNV